MGKACVLVSPKSLVQCCSMQRCPSAELAGPPTLLPCVAVSACSNALINTFSPLVHLHVLLCSPVCLVPVVPVVTSLPCLPRTCCIPVVTPPHCCLPVVPVVTPPHTPYLPISLSLLATFQPWAHGAHQVLHSITRMPPTPISCWPAPCPTLATLFLPVTFRSRFLCHTYQIRLPSCVFLWSSFCRLPNTLPFSHLLYALDTLCLSASPSKCAEHGTHCSSVLLQLLANCQEWAHTFSGVQTEPRRWCAHF